MTDLNGKVALVTGGSRGIGEAIAEALTDAGAAVAISSRRQEALELVADRLRKKGGHVLPIAAHNARPQDLAQLVDAVTRELGVPDVLVNNAGTNPVFGPINLVDEEAWDKILDVNLKGAFVLSKRVGELMMERGSGSIINIASVAGLRAAPGLGAYSVSKAGLIMLTRVCAVEWAPAGVRVNCVAPGLVETKFAKLLIETPAIYEEVLRRTPLGRHAQPDELTGAVLFLASDASRYVTGQVLCVDGGQLAA